MSEKDFSSKIERSVIDRMSIDTLKGLIKDDFGSPNGMLDTDTLLYISEVLAKKEEVAGNEAPDIEASLEKFKREYAPNNEKNSTLDNAKSADELIAISNHKPRKKVSRLLLVAAAIIILMVAGAVGVSAAGINLWDTIVSWASETFGFNEQADETDKSDNKHVPQQLMNLSTILRDNAVNPDFVLPTYLPKGYTQKEILNLDVEYYIMVVCSLNNGNSEIVFQYKIFDGSDGSNVYQKDDSNLEEYIVGGITHYISSNKGEYLCVWVNDNVECSIFGVNSREEIVKIIDSIYGE